MIDILTVLGDTFSYVSLPCSEFCGLFIRSTGWFELCCLSLASYTSTFVFFILFSATLIDGFLLAYPRARRREIYVHGQNASSGSEGLAHILLRRAKGKTYIRALVAFQLLLLRAGDVHPNPGPITTEKPLRFYSCNINSLKSATKRIGLQASLAQNGDPDIILLQETKLDIGILNSELPLNGFTIHRLDRNRNGGGILIAVRSDLKCSVQNQLYMAPSEMIWVEIAGLARGHKILVGNYYRPNKNDAISATAMVDSLALATQYATRVKAKIVLSGDFNCPDVDWAETGGPFRANDSQKQIRDALSDATLSQLVTTPTRGNNILDLVCSSHPGLICDLTVTPAFSDHHGISFSLLRKLTPPKVNPVPTFNWKRADWDAMRPALERFSQDYDQQAPMRSLEDNWSSIKSTLLQTMGNHVPKSVKRSRAKPLPRDVIQLCRQRDRAYRLLRLSPTPENRRRYNSLRNRARRACARAHRNHLNRISEALASDNPKPFWRHIANTRTDRSEIPDMLNQGRLVNNPTEKASLFNDQFFSVFTNEQQYTYLPDLPRPRAHMGDFVISEEGVRRRLEKLIESKATGPDEIPARFLKIMAPILARPISQLFQQSFSTGVVPRDWKNAIVRPIFKKGDKSMALNYRPVSLTCILCKQMEHIIVSQMNSFLNSHGLLYDRQHGFRSGQSCETALASLVHDWAYTIDMQGAEIDSIMLDFSKAFDTVPHRRLIHKIEHFGISPTVCTWISSFLTGRYQKVVISGESSTWLPVTSGIPQGSVLGPLLFSLYINDIHYGMTQGTKVNLFADDSIIYREIKSRRDCQILQSDIDVLTEWSNTWLLKFNVGKCAHMRISRRLEGRHPPVEVPHYALCGENLPRSESEKYLGVTIQANLKFDQHIQTTISRSNSLIGLLKRNLAQCSVAAKLTAYSALIRSRLEYCCSIFDPWTVSLTTALEGVQNRAARFIVRDYSRHSSVSAMKTRLGLELLQSRRKTHRHKFVRKFASGDIIIPGLVLFNRGQGMEPFPPVYTRLAENTVFYKTYKEINHANWLAQAGAAPQLVNPP